MESPSKGHDRRLGLDVRRPSKLLRAVFVAAWAFPPIFEPGKPLQPLLPSAKRIAFALVLAWGIASPAVAQRLSIEAGGGLGVTTTAAHDYVLQGFLEVRRALSPRLGVGVDVSTNVTKDIVCGPTNNGCVSEFPDIAALSLPVDLQLARLDLGFGPGVFRLRRWADRVNSPGDHLYVGGLAGHADLMLVNFGRIRIIASVRPLLALGGARSAGDRIGVVPVTLGLRW
jgi:hypothetical protein